MKKQIVLIISMLVALAVGYFIGIVLPIAKSGADAGADPMTAMMKSMMGATVNAEVVKEFELEIPTKHIAMVEPIEDAMIRAEVSGYIEKVHFIEGGMVAEGDLLFTIDSSLYRAAVSSCEAELAQAKAEQARAHKFNDRMQQVDARSISQNDLDKAESDLLGAEASVKRAEAAMENAKINLARTEIRAPISGRIGAAEMTKGNYATPTAGVLARIVRLDPIRVMFSLTDREYLTLRREELADEAKVLLGRVRLSDGTELATTGKKDFDDNAVNPKTGTVAVRYLFDNKDGLLMPGSFVTALLEKTDAEKGILIPQRALLSNQQGTHVLTIGEEGMVTATPITTGAQVGKKIVVESGLKLGDRIIVDGVQKAIPGMPVKFVLVEE